MTEELDTGEDTAQEEPVDAELESVDTEQADQDEPQKPFSAEQEQYLGSWFGRIVADQIDKKVAPLIQDRQQEPVYQPAPVDALKGFNEEITEQFFGGDPTGAFNKMMRVHQDAQSNMAKTKRTETDRAITEYSDDPSYKDIYQDMRKIAHEKTASGFPPTAAAELAFERAKRNLYEGKLTNADGGSNLNMASSGRQSRETKKFKIRPEFKKACARDIADGLYKDEAEWLEGLSPANRAKAII